MVATFNAEVVRGVVRVYREITFVTFELEDKSVDNGLDVCSANATYRVIVSLIAEGVAQSDLDAV